MSSKHPETRGLAPKSEGFDVSQIETCRGYAQLLAKIGDFAKFDLKVFPLKLKCGIEAKLVLNNALQAIVVFFNFYLLA